MQTLPTLQSLYPSVDDLLAAPPEELVPLLLKFARHVLTLQNGMFDPNYVNQLATETNNRQQQQPRYSHAERQKVERLLGEAWAFIESERLIMAAPGVNGTHGFKVFTRRGEAISDEVDIEKLQETAAFPKALIHPIIADKVWGALMRNDLDEAVFTSFKAVEEAVRSAGGYSANELGTNLMRAAFDKNRGPLADMSQPDGEREALAHLFAGAIGSYKNPHSHRTVNLTDLREAQEQVMLATHLLRIVEARRRLIGSHDADRH